MTAPDVSPHATNFPSVEKATDKMSPLYRLSCFVWKKDPEEKMEGREEIWNDRGQFPQEDKVSLLLVLPRSRVTEC